MENKEKFLTTGIGSVPYLNIRKSVKNICAGFDIPFWPQFPKKSFKENMFVQFAEGLPSLVIDEANRKIYVDTNRDLSEALGLLYEAYLSEDYESYGFTRDFAEGFYAFLDIAKDFKPGYVKGHVTGPVSFGLSIADEKGKAILYNDTLKDALVKLLEMKACFQIDKLKGISENVIIFVDEPYLTSFGSSFISIERGDILLMLNALIDKIHSKGALAGIHCCGNTDWSLFTETGVDIINFDAYAYANGVSLYPAEINTFLAKGGSLAWGIVPTSAKAEKETGDGLFNKLVFAIDELEKKGISRKLVISHSLITPSCGMGSLPEDLADSVIKKISVVARLAKDKLQ